MASRSLLLALFLSVLLATAAAASAGGGHDDNDDDDLSFLDDGEDEDLSPDDEYGDGNYSDLEDFDPSGDAYEDEPADPDAPVIDEKDVAVLIGINIYVHGPPLPHSSLHPPAPLPSMAAIRGGGGSDEIFSIIPDCVAEFDATLFNEQARTTLLQEGIAEVSAKVAWLKAMEDSERRGVIGAIRQLRAKLSALWKQYDLASTSHNGLVAGQSYSIGTVQVLYRCCPWGGFKNCSQEARSRCTIQICGDAEARGAR